jgi:hypothetical protein
MKKFDFKTIYYINAKKKKLYLFFNYKFKILKSYNVFFLTYFKKSIKNLCFFFYNE